MREIKFRAWDKIDKRMITHEQDFIPLKVSSIGVLKLNPSTEYESWILIEPDRIELMQYTGLKDKNGKEIYEGDLLLCKDGKVYPVSFESGTFIIDEEPLCFDLEAEERQPMRVHPKDFATVIGNIYENPELLNSEPEVQGSVARDGDSSTSDDQQKQLEYYKARCEAAEKLLSTVPIKNGNRYLAGFDEYLKTWQALKNQTP